MSEILERQFSIRARCHVVDFLHAKTGLSKTRIKDAMSKGAVWLNHQGENRRLRRGSRELEIGDGVAIYYNPEVLAASPPTPELICDQKSYSVWYKPAGLLSSGSRFGDHHSIVRWVEIDLQRSSYTVHRLDRSTRGLILIAHNKSTAGHLARQFRERLVRKRYQARIEGRLEERCTLTVEIDGKPAVTHVMPENIRAEDSDVDVVIETGRKHQIRRHLAGIGHPVIGDTMYGSAEVPDLQLIAVALGFHCPLADKWVDFELPEKLHLFAGTQGERVDELT